MIKKFCDRCGKEIAGEPYHMKWSQNSSCGAAMFSDLCSRADAVSAYSHAITLSADPMYCGECRAAIIAFASKKPERDGTEVGDGEAVDAIGMLVKYCGNRDCDTCIFLKDGICVIAGGYSSLHEVLAFARGKFREKNGGKK